MPKDENGENQAPLADGVEHSSEKHAGPARSAGSSLEPLKKGTVTRRPTDTVAARPHGEVVRYVNWWRDRRTGVLLVTIMVLILIVVIILIYRPDGRRALAGPSPTPSSSTSTASPARTPSSPASTPSATASASPSATTSPPPSPVGPGLRNQGSLNVANSFSQLYDLDSTDPRWGEGQVGVFDAEFESYGGGAILVEYSASFVQLAKGTVASYSTCRDMSGYGGQGTVINYSDLYVGEQFCFFTNDKRYSLLRVTSVSAPEHTLTFRVKTWQL